MAKVMVTLRLDPEQASLDQVRELLGLTAEERPCKTIKDRVGIEDLHASIYRAVGISPKLAYEIEKRPFYTTRDGLGQPVADLFA